MIILIIVRWLVGQAITLEAADDVEVVLTEICHAHSALRATYVSSRTPLHLIDASYGKVIASLVFFVLVSSTPFRTSH